MHIDNSSALFNLIHALSKGEKRYFKLHVNSRSSHIENKNYLRLFTAIEKQKEYSETKIIKLGIVKEKHLPMLKNYLYQLILESIRTLNSKSNILDNRLQNMLDNAQILFDKHMEEEGIAFLMKAKKLAITYERWGIALDALLMEIEENTRRRDVQQLELTTTEMSLLLDKITNLHEYLKLRKEVYKINGKLMVSRSNQNILLEQLLATPLFSNENQAMSTQAKNIYYNALVHAHGFRNDFKTANDFIYNHLQFVESNYSSLKNVEFIHSSILNNLTIIQMFLKDYPAAFKTIQKHRLFGKDSIKAKESAFFYSISNEIKFHITKGDFEKGIPLVKEVEKKLNKIENRLFSLSLVLYFNCALTYFGIGDYRTAQQWIIKILRHPKITMRNDIQATSHLLQIIIHYELHTPDILEYLLTSTHRFLITREQLYKVEDSFIQFMRNLVNKDFSQKESLTVFRNYRKELVKILKDPKEQLLINNFNLIAWIDSKIENKFFAEIIKRNHKHPK